MQSTLKNRTIFCRDNIDVLQGINNETIDLVYLDPPFNKKRTFHAPIGSIAEGASFRDTWYDEDIKKGYLTLIADLYPTLYQYLKGVEEIESRSHRNYLIYMAQRLIEIKRILKDTGSVYLHCDNTMSHYLKLLMDCVFGHQNFRNEIVWKRSTTKGTRGEKKTLGTITDLIYFYGKSSKHTVNIPKIMRADKLQDFKYSDKKGQYRAVTPLMADKHLHDCPHYEWKGLNPKYGWRVSQKNLKDMYKEDKIYFNSKGKPYKKEYIKDYQGQEVGNLWADISIAKNNERVGYPTQKPLALLERIIQASSNEGDIVLDPFCGCATTCVASEKLGRQWIGIDVSQKAYELVKMRLSKEVTDKSDLLKYQNEVIYREDVPQRTDIKNIDLSYSKNKIEVKHLLYEEQEGECKGCHSHFEYRHFDIDHIVPKSKGGGDNKENLQLLCSHCNRIKGDNDMPYLIKRLKELNIL